MSIGAAAGKAASWVKSLSERRLQALFERLVQPTAAQKELVGLLMRDGVSGSVGEG